jgi:hypothetical protein
MRILNRVRLWLNRDQRECELDDEIRLHRDMLADEFERDGISRADALAKANRRMGHVASAKESSFDEWSFPRLDSLVQDIRYAVRGLGRSRAFALTAVLTLGIGLGINTVIFTLFNAYALRPLAVRDPSSLYQVLSQGKQNSVSRFSWLEFKELRLRDDILRETLAQGNAYGLVNGNPSIGLLVSGNYFSMLGAGMQLGRPLLESDTRLAEILRRQAVGYRREALTKWEPVRNRGCGPAGIHGV